MKFAVTPLLVVVQVVTGCGVGSSANDAPPASGPLSLRLASGKVVELTVENAGYQPDHSGPFKATWPSSDDPLLSDFAGGQYVLTERPPISYSSSLSDSSGRVAGKLIIEHLGNAEGNLAGVVDRTWVSLAGSFTSIGGTLNTVTLGGSFNDVVLQDRQGNRLLVGGHWKLDLGQPK